MKNCISWTVALAVVSGLVTSNPRATATDHKLKEYHPPGAETTTGEHNTGDASFDEGEVVQPTDGVHTGTTEVDPWGGDGTGTITMQSSGWCDLDCTGKVESEDAEAIDIGPASMVRTGKRTVVVTHSSGNCGGKVTIGFAQNVKVIGDLNSGGDNKVTDFLQWFKARFIMINSSVYEKEWKVKYAGTTSSTESVATGNGAEVSVGIPSSHVSVDSNTTSTTSSTFTTSGSPDDNIDETAWAHVSVSTQCSANVTIETTTEGILRLKLTNGDPSDFFTVEHKSKLRNRVAVYAMVEAAPGSGQPEDPPPPDTGGGTVTPDEPFIPPVYATLGSTRYRAGGGLLNATYVPDPDYRAVVARHGVTEGRTVPVHIWAEETDTSDREIDVAMTGSGIVNAPSTVTLLAGRLSVDFEIEGQSEGTSTVTLTFPDDSEQVFDIDVGAVPLTPSFDVVGNDHITISVGEPQTFVVRRSDYEGVSLDASVLSLSVDDPGSCLDTLPSTILIPAGAASTTLTIDGVATGTATVTLSFSGVDVAVMDITVSAAPALVSMPTITIELGGAVNLSIPVTGVFTSQRPCIVEVISETTNLSTVASPIMIDAGQDCAILRLQGDGEGTTTLRVTLQNGNEIEFDVITTTSLE